MIGTVGGYLWTEYQKFNIVLKQNNYIKKLKLQKTINLLLWLLCGFILWIIFVYFYSINYFNNLSFKETCDRMKGTIENNNCLLPNWE